MSLHYFCKACDHRWCGDCWCPECGRVSKVDHKRDGFYAGGRPPVEREKWTVKNARKDFRIAQARRKAKKY